MYTRRPPCLGLLPPFNVTVQTGVVAIQLCATSQCFGQQYTTYLMFAPPNHNGTEKFSGLVTCSCSNIIATARYLRVCGDAGAQCLQCLQRGQHVLGLHTQRPSLTDSSRTTSSPAGSIDGKRLLRVHHLNSLYCISTEPFLHLDPFHCVPAACSIQYSNMLYRFLAWEL